MDSRYSTYERVARESSCSRTTIKAVLDGERFPQRQFIERFVVTCVPEGIERERQLAKIRALWEETFETIREIRLSQRASEARPDNVDEADIDEQVLLASQSAERDRKNFEKALVPVTFYRNNSEFYSAAAEYARSASSIMRLTYLRHVPPVQITSQEAADYFAAVLEWARQPGHRSALRIISAPMSGQAPEPIMLNWIKSHYVDVQEVLNYDVRILPWMPRGDGLNMALFDEDTVFVAVSGESRQHVNGLTLSGRRVHQYFADHFTQLWHNAEPIQSFVQKFTV